MIKLEFTGVNYLVCEYCKSLGIIPGKQDDTGVCSSRPTEKGHYKVIAFHDSDMTIDGRKGCSKFEPSGMPVHPSIADKLIEQNSLAEKIPVDLNATETSYDFASKRKKYPYMLIQREPTRNGGPKYRLTSMQEK